MLGQLLELSIAARPPLAEAVDAFVSLGLASVPVGDIVAAPLAVVADEGLAIGIHDAEAAGLAPALLGPTFVRPKLEQHVRALRRRGIEFELLELGRDQFHRGSFRDPNGLGVVLIEARTFAAAAPRPRAISACGDFAELSVATHSVEESAAFWSALGFERVAGFATPHPSARLQGHGLTLGFHETARFRAALTFSAGNLAGRVEYLRAKGFEVARGTPVASGESATLVPAAGVAFYLLAEDAAPDRA